jgi:hypothetical protein
MTVILLNGYIPLQSVPLCSPDLNARYLSLMHQRFFSGMLQRGLQEFDPQHVQTFAPVILVRTLKVTQSVVENICFLLFACSKAEMNPL